MSPTLLFYSVVCRLHCLSDLSRTLFDNMALDHQPPKALFFDVFGTCVDWRKSVTDELWNACREALNSPTSSIATRIRVVATDMVRFNPTSSPHMRS